MKILHRLLNFITVVILQCHAEKVIDGQRAFTSFAVCLLNNQWNLSDGTSMIIIVDSKRLVLTSGGARSRAFLYFLNQRQPLVNQPLSSHKFEGYDGAIHDEIRFKEF